MKTLYDNLRNCIAKVDGNIMLDYQDEIEDQEIKSDFCEECGESVSVEELERNSMICDLCASGRRIQ